MQPYDVESHNEQDLNLRTMHHFVSTQSTLISGQCVSGPSSDSADLTRRRVTKTPLAPPPDIGKHSGADGRSPGD